MLTGRYTSPLCATVRSADTLAPAAQLDIKVALSNSFGFGGHNSCILFKAFES